ncbi:MAG: hypothetical protein J6X95_10095 [Treponema sp.]|nr:hypothetical protein [Treponema sp.]
MKIVFKKKFAALLAACVAAIAIASNAFALDYGGAFSNYTRLKGKSFSNIKLDQVNDLSGWIKYWIPGQDKMYVTAEAIYEFEYDAAASKAFNRLDIDLLKFSGTWSVAQRPLTINAGRFIFSDYTGLIMNQNCDGVWANYKLPMMSISAYMGYTGLLNAAFVKMQNHPKDAFKYKTDKVYQLAEKYFVTAAGVSVPNLFGRHCALGQVLATFKMGGKSFNRFYFTAGMNGPIWQSLYYSATTTFGLHSFDGSVGFTNLTKATVSYYFDFMDLTATGGIVYASGDNGPFKAFYGFTKIDAYSAFNEPQHTGVFKITAGATIKPIQKVLAKLDTALVFDVMEKAKYKGFEWSVGADWQILSDAKVGASFLQYIDKDNKDVNKVQLALDGTITF